MANYSDYVGFKSSDENTRVIQTSGVDRLIITESGEWGVNGANYGTSGEVLTSQGAGVAPAWGTVSAGSSLSGATDDVTPFNTFLGAEAGVSITTGLSNVGVGYSALSGNTSGLYNVAVGYAALSVNTTGRDDAAVGYEALLSNISGLGNVAVGYSALRANTIGDENVAIGRNSLRVSTTGNKNVAVGEASLNSILTGRQNTAIGTETGTTLTAGNNNVLVGFSAQPSAASVSNEFTLGNSSITTLRCQQTTITALSDARDKTDVKDLSYGIPFIQALRPVEFEWNTRDKTKVGVKDIGFIAQELDEVEQQFNSTDYTRLVYKSNPEKLEATYMRTYPILVKAVQELIQEVAGLKATLA